MTIRLDRVQAAMMGVIGASTSAVGLWAPSTYPRRSLGDRIITVKVVQCPPPSGSFSRYQSNEPTVLRWTVSGVIPNQRIGLGMTGRRWMYDVPGSGATVTTIRNAVWGLIAASEPDLVLSAVGVDTLEISGSVGALYRPASIGYSSISIETEVETEVVTKTVRLDLEAQAYATGRGPDAMGLLAEFVGGFPASDILELMDQFGVDYQGAGDILDLTAIAGAEWESRAAIRFILAARFYRAHAVSIVESAEMGISTVAPATYTTVNV